MHVKRYLLVLASAAAVTVGGLATTVPARAAAPAPEQPPPASASVGGFHVSGNQIIGPDGRPVTFKGIDISGDIATSRGIVGSFVGGGDTVAQTFGAMRAWGFNLLRMHLNDGVWLDAACTTYRPTVEQYVAQATADGMAVELTLGNSELDSSCEDRSGDANAYYPNALEFWSQVAQTFRNNPLVIFEPYNEPWIIPQGDPFATLAPGEDPDAVWLTGMAQFGSSTRATLSDGTQIVGMQEMYDAIRSAGATNLVFITGQTFAPTNYAYDTYDSLKVVERHQVQGYNVVYATHIYPNWDPNLPGAPGCNPVLPTTDTGIGPLDNAGGTAPASWGDGGLTETAWNAAILPVAATYPVVLDEFGAGGGEGCTFSEGGEPIALTQIGEEDNSAIVSYADEHHLGYVAFDWSWYGPGVLNNWTNFGPNGYGIPIYRDLRNDPCELASLFCPAYVFANPPRPNDYEPPVTSVSSPAVSISPTTAAGAQGVDYTVDFTASQEGLIASGGWVRIQAPPGTSFYGVSAPKVIDLTSGQDVQASCCDQVGDQSYQYGFPGTLNIPDGVVLAAASNVITIPIAGTVSPGDQVVVLLDGVTNPPSGPLSLQVSTSTDRAPAASSSVALTPAQPVSALSESLSSYAAGATGVTWTTTFATSSTGAMSGLWPGGTVTITAPSGTDFSNSMGDATLEDLTTGQPVAGGYLSESAASYTFALRSPVTAGDTLQLVVGNVTNPPAGTYSVSVATSSDTVPASSGSFTIS